MNRNEDLNNHGAYAIKPIGKNLILMIVSLFFAAILMVNVALFRTRSNSAQSVFLATAQLQGLCEALKMYQSDHNDFPSVHSGLAALRLPVARGPYITKEMLLDPWGRAYLYFFDKSGEPIVRTLGRNGKVGGAGLDKDMELGPNTTESLLPKG